MSGIRLLKKLLKACLPERLIGALRTLLFPQRFAVVHGPLTYNQDGLATIHDAGALEQPRFAEAYRLGQATGSWRESSPKWRTYVTCWAAARGAGLAGDFVECGVHRGGMARAVMHYIGFEQMSDRTFYLIDTFEGIVPAQFAEEETERHVYDACHEDVIATFAPFPAVRVIQGVVPEVLEQLQIERVCFLSIDMNCAAPEIAAATYFWEKLSTGAVVVLDDYNNPGHRLQKERFDAFARERATEVLSLPTGQGLLFKI